MTGWLVKIQTEEPDWKRNSYYKIIKSEVGDKLYGPSCQYTEEGALLSINSLEPDTGVDKSFWIISPIRKILDIEKTAWQEPPENLEGWLVCIKFESGETIYKVVTNVRQENNTIKLIGFPYAYTEKSAIQFSKEEQSHFRYEIELGEAVIPIRYVGVK